MVGRYMNYKYKTNMPTARGVDHAYQVLHAKALQINKTLINIPPLFQSI